MHSLHPLGISLKIGPQERSAERNSPWSATPRPTDLLAIAVCYASYGLFADFGTLQKVLTVKNDST